MVITQPVVSAVPDESVMRTDLALASIASTGTITSGVTIGTASTAAAAEFNYNNPITALANSVARQNNLSDWSYVDCTVTGSSDCATKVR